MNKILFLFLLAFNIDANLHSMDTYYEKIYKTLRPCHANTEKFLATCIQTGSYFLAKHIVNKTEVNLNYIDQEKRTFVHLTILSKVSHQTKCDFLQLFFKHNVKIDAQDTCGNTALYYACLQMSPEVMKILLKNRASLDRPNNKHETARNIVQSSLVHPTYWKNLDKKVAAKHKTITELLQNNITFPNS